MCRLKLLLLILWTPVFLVPQIKFSSVTSKPNIVFNELNKVIIPERGEFETYQEYLKKVPKADTNRIYIFEIPVTTKFRFDDSVLILLIGDFSNHSGIIEEPRGVSYIESNLQTVIEPSRYYVGTNAMGVRVNVLRKKYTNYIVTNIHFNNLYIYDTFQKDTNECYYQSSTISVYKNIEPVLAKSLAQNIKAVGYFRFKGFDYRFSEVEYAKPTIDMPTEIITNIYKIGFSLDKIVLYRKDTKRIVSTLVINQAPNK